MRCSWTFLAFCGFVGLLDGSESPTNAPAPKRASIIIIHARTNSPASRPSEPAGGAVAITSKESGSRVERVHRLDRVQPELELQQGSPPIRPATFD